MWLYMGKNTLTHAIIIILISLILLTVVFAVLTGKNGIINQEINKYNDTHVEEKQEQLGNNIVIVDNNKVK